MAALRLKAVAGIVLCLFFARINGLSAAGQTTTKAKNGMVVSSSMIASEVGRNILRTGGNATDAAVATAFALAVTLPAAGNVGGGGFMVYHGADGEITSFDFREKAPLAAGPDMYLDQDGNVRDNSNHAGLLAVGVPGTVAGLYLAHQRLGSKPWAELVEPAVRLAEEGFELTWGIYTDATGRLKPRFKKYPSTTKVMYKSDGDFYEPGELWQQHDLARTLRRIQQQGPDGFYKGETARKLAQFMKNNGGLITEADLAKYRAIERKPVHGTYRGYDVYSMPPPSSGGVVLIEMLNILESYDLKKMGHNSALYLHLVTEAMRRGFADRALFLGDPDFNPEIPLEKLLSKSHAQQQRTNIALSVASKSDSAMATQPEEGTHTTHFAVVDSDGNTVSLTYTIEYWYGTGIIAEGLGFFLNNEMGDFNAVPGLTNSKGRIGTAPNLIAPGKRMLSSMTPTIVAKDGKPLMAIGSPGGRTIINTVLQVILNVLDHGMNIGRAVEAGRIHHQWLPDVTVFEPWSMSLDSQRLYKSMGHNLREKPYGGQGRAMGILINYADGVLEGAADTRSQDGGAAGF